MATTRQVKSPSSATSLCQRLQMPLTPISWCKCPHEQHRHRNHPLHCHSPQPGSPQLSPTGCGLPCSVGAGEACPGQQLNACTVSLTPKRTVKAWLRPCSEQVRFPFPTTNIFSCSSRTRWPRKCFKKQAWKNSWTELHNVDVKTLMQEASCTGAQAAYNLESNACVYSTHPLQSTFHSCCARNRHACAGQERLNRLSKHYQQCTEFLTVFETDFLNVFIICFIMILQSPNSRFIMFKISLCLTWEQDSVQTIPPWGWPIQFWPSVSY